VGLARSEYFHRVPSTESEQPRESIPAETINRNWTELIQEMRSTQTGMQVLTAFLLTLPYSDKFDTLDRVQRIAYLLVLVAAICGTAVVMSPIAHHRILFRRGRRPWLVATANRVARTALVLVALITCGVLFLTFDLTVGRIPAVIASALAVIGYLLLWVGVPLRAHR
jgi:hypothetical protein